MDLEPERVLGVEPSPQVSGTVALHHVDHLGLVEVDEAGGVDGVVVPRRREERGLVDAEGSDPTDALWILDERGAVADDGVHHRPPAHPELVGHDGDRQRELAHLAGRFGSGTHGEQGPGGHPGRLLAPGLGVAVAVRATPATLEPDEPGWTAETRQVPDIDPLAFMGEGPDPTTRAADHVEGRLDADPQLVGELGDREHPEAVKSQQRVSQGTSVVHQSEVSFVGVFEQQQRLRDL